MMIVPLNAYTVYYATSVGMGDATLGRYITIQLFISLVQAYPIGWLVDRYHALRVTIVALACFAAATLVSFFVVGEARSFGIAVVVCGAMAGFGGTASAAVGTVLFPREKFGTFYSVQLVANAVGTMLVAPVCGWTLDQLNHDYRYMYLWAAVLAGLAVLANLVVYRRFLAYGGLKAYLPPQ